MADLWKLSYRLLMQPLLWQVLQQQAKRKPNLRAAIAGREGLWERLDLALQQRDWRQPLLWFHAASAGEILQAEPVIRRLPLGQVQIVLTYSSVNAERWITAGHTRLPAQVIWSDYLPRDTERNMRRLIAKLQPAALILVSYDLWPNLVWTAQALKVPQFLISALVHQGSFRHQNALGRSLFSSLYQAQRTIATISTEDAERIRQSAPHHPDLQVIGDTRVDSVLARRDAQTPPPLPESWQHGTTFIAGSVWPEDVACIRAPLLDALNSDPQLRVVLTPHEPHAAQVEALQRDFAAWSPVLWTQRDATELDRARVLIVDTVGVLSGLYAHGHLAFVGGAFTTGVHNVMEPAAWGLPVFFGPKYDNYLSAQRFLEAGLAFSVNDAATFQAQLQPLLANPTRCQTLGAQARALLEEQAGAAKRCAQLLEPIWQEAP
jgi:3-deoxy-D-manno-octulosonic-acid transferase